MNEAGEEGNGVWPPPPAAPRTKEAGPPPKRRRVTDQGVGRASLALSALGSLCALACVVSIVADTHDHWFGLWNVLEFGSIGCFFAGFFVGFVGWYSWEGRVGLGLAVLSPLWLVAAFLVDATHGP